MLDSIPVAFQVVLWLLLGAVVVVAASRVLPHWLCRIVALLAVLASLARMWSLRAGPIEAAEIMWKPISFFRMGPSLHPDSLSLMVGITLAWFTAGILLGVRGSESRKSSWHGLILVALAGCLVMAMAANLLTVALGSALLDMALIALAVSSPGAAGRVIWRIALPGMVSSVVLVLAALQMDTQLGTASLQAQGISAETMGVVVVAGALRLWVFPLHPWGLRTPQNAAISILSVGSGLYLLARCQAIAPMQVVQPWVAFLAAASLVGGGVRAWTTSLSWVARPGVPPNQDPSPTKSAASEFADAWPSFALHQTGLALAYLILVVGPVPWPLFTLVVALGTLIVWWDAGTEIQLAPRAEQLRPLVDKLVVWRTRARNALAARVPALQGSPVSKLTQQWRILLPALALACMAGAPLTAGATGRWRFYASLLQQGLPAPLIVALLADAFLAASLWATVRRISDRASAWRPSPAALAAMIAFVTPLILFGIAPGLVQKEPLEPPNVSTWALAVAFVGPWFLGGLLVQIGPNLSDRLRPALRIVNLNGLYRAAAWTGQQVVAAVHWLGLVGEGDGWFGWALIVLALGAMLLAVR